MRSTGWILGNAIDYVGRGAWCAIPCPRGLGPAFSPAVAEKVMYALPTSSASPDSKPGGTAGLLIDNASRDAIVSFSANSTSSTQLARSLNLGVLTNYNKRVRRSSGGSACSAYLGQ
jgi:hypothetical protein